MICGHRKLDSNELRIVQYFVSFLLNETKYCAVGIGNIEFPVVTTVCRTAGVDSGPLTSAQFIYVGVVMSGPDGQLRADNHGDANHVTRCVCLSGSIAYVVLPAERTAPTLIGRRRHGWHQSTLHFHVLLLQLTTPFEICPYFKLQKK